jgi:hypothetical protein
MDTTTGARWSSFTITLSPLLSVYSLPAAQAGYGNKLTQMKMSAKLGRAGNLEIAIIIFSLTLTNSE